MTAKEKATTNENEWKDGRKGMKKGEEIKKEEKKKKKEKKENRKKRKKSFNWKSMENPAWRKMKAKDKQLIHFLLRQHVFNARQGVSTPSLK